MGRKNFRIIIHSKKMYHEVEITGEAKRVCIGTTGECKIRFNRSMFFRDFKIDVEWEGDVCRMECDSAIYFSSDGIRKLYSVKLEHGTEYRVMYLDNNAELFWMEILYDFDDICEYNCVFPFPGEELIIGGNAQAAVRIEDDIVGDDYILLKKRQKEGWIADGSHSKLGVYINGKRCMGETEIPEGTFVMLAGYSFFLKGGQVYTASKENVQFALPVREIKESGNVFRYPAFNRTARKDYRIREEEIEVLSPMAKAEAPEQNFALMLAPVAISLVLTIVIRGVMGNGGAFVIYSVCTMLTGAIMSVVTARMNLKKYRKKEQKRVADYRAYIEEKEAYIQQAQEDERRLMEEKLLSMERELALVETFDERLFEKDVYDTDFLTVRLGTGDLPSKCEITYKKEEFKNTEDELSEYPRQLYETYRILQNAPVAGRFLEANAVGIVGSKKLRYQYFERLVMELAVRHFYKEIKTAFLLDGEIQPYCWVGWLRNAETEDGEGRLIASDEESSSQLLEFLYAELTRRGEKSGEQNLFVPFYVVFVTDYARLKTHPVSKYIADAAAYGFLFLFFEEYGENLPYGITQLVELTGEGKGSLMFCDDCDRKQTFCWDALPQGAMEQVAVRLAPLAVAEISLEGAMTKNITLFRLLGIMNVTDIDLNRNWQNSRIDRSMAAPLGVKGGDEVVYLDLHEKAHGPHGLVAGTTGSGKSEILQSYILSMALLFHPYEVSFVIIDFKGGGMVNQFRELPHLTGAITNIDGKEINRSLLSIKAELKKRQELFAQAEVNHIDAYIRKYKSGACKVPLPHLVLIVDEFAELKSEQPEFMKELISAARIGRSLGVHLILATQKPSGVVDEQIWSNSKFRLCLKVQNKEDSNEVLKSPLAAEIREPGRAYLQVGNNEIFELFQSAYSGASIRSEEIDHRKPFSLYEVNFHGRRSLIYEQKASENSGETQTQLEAIVEYIQEYCLREKIERLPGICLAPLPEYLTYDGRTQPLRKEGGILIPLGIYDDPSHQRQEEVWMDISSSHVFIVGSAQYGKTNILQTILRSAAENYSPAEVNFYILDFASMILKNFETLAHVGGVVLLSEDEKMKTFMKMMASELKERKEKLSGLGLSSFSAYREAGYTELRQFVVVIDNFAAFREIYGEYEDAMLTLLRDGISVGISVVAANGQTSGLGYKFLATFAKRIGLFCNDSGEYSNLFDRCRMTPGNLAGRGLVEIERTVYEYQSYLSFEGEKEIERVGHMRRFAEEINRKSGGVRARQIPEIPAVLTERHMSDTYGISRKNTCCVPVGIDYENIAPVIIRLEQCGVLGVMGRECSGKSNFVRLLLAQLYQNLFSNPSQIFVLDDGRRQMEEYAEWGNVKEYSLDASDYIGWMEELAEELKQRYDTYLREGERALQEIPLLVYVIQNTEAAYLLSKSTEGMKQYREIVGKYRNLKWCMIYANVENSAVSYSGPEVLKLMKENRNLMFFDELSNMKFLDVTNQQAKAYKKAISPGDAFYFKGNDIVKLKTIKTEGSVSDGGY